MNIENRAMLLSEAACVLQVKVLPRAVTVRTAYEVGNWSYHVRHRAAWGNQKFSFSGLYSAPPLDLGNQTLRGKNRKPTHFCHNITFLGYRSLTSLCLLLQFR